MVQNARRDRRTDLNNYTYRYRFAGRGLLEQAFRQLRTVTSVKHCLVRPRFNVR